MKKIISTCLALFMMVTPAVVIANESHDEQIALLQAQILLLQNEIERIVAERVSEKNSLTSGLEVGSKGEQVTELQEFLVEQGVYPEGIISGYYGPLTQTAVDRFESKFAAFSQEAPTSSDAVEEIPVNSEDITFTKELFANTYSVDEYTEKTTLTLALEDSYGFAVEADFDLASDIDITNDELYLEADGEIEVDFGFFVFDGELEGEMVITQEGFYARLNDSTFDLPDEYTDEWYGFTYDELEDFIEEDEVFVELLGDYPELLQDSFSVQEALDTFQEHPYFLIDESSMETANGMQKYRAYIDPVEFMENYDSQFEGEYQMTAEERAEMFAIVEAVARDANIYAFVDDGTFHAFEMEIDTVIEMTTVDFFSGAEEVNEITLMLEVYSEFEEASVSIDAPDSYQSVFEL